MPIITPKYLSDRLRNAPQSVLERVAAYMDELMEDQTNNFILTEEQKYTLDSQDNLQSADFLNADTVFKNLKMKYEL